MFTNIQHLKSYVNEQSTECKKPMISHIPLRSYRLRETVTEAAGPTVVKGRFPAPLSEAADSSTN